MKMTPKTYQKYADAHAPKSPVAKNCLFAFLSGGTICTLGQGLLTLYRDVWGMSPEDAGTLSSVTLIFLSVLLTSLGVFDRIAKHAGAGTLVPITGFANAVSSPAIDSRAEGYVLGVGAKIFAVAGPVLLYAVLSGAIYGVLYWAANTVL